MSSKFLLAFPLADPQWSARVFAQLLHTGALPPTVIRLAFLLRALDLQNNPPGLPGTLCPFCETSAPDMRHHVWDACPEAHLRLTTFRSVTRRRLLALSPAPLDSPSILVGAARDASPPVLDRLTVQVSYSGLWRVTIPPHHPGYVPVGTRAQVTVTALNLLTARTSIPRVQELLSRDPQHRLVGYHRPDVRVLDPHAPLLTPPSSLVLTLILRTLREWVLVLVAAPGLPLPSQPQTGARTEVLSAFSEPSPTPSRPGSWPP